VADAGLGWVRRFLPVAGDQVPADYVNGLRADGTHRFDRLGGMAVRDQ